MGCLPPINWWQPHFAGPSTVSQPSPIFPSFSHHSPTILPSSSRGAWRGARNAAWWRWRPTCSWAASWSSGAKRCPFRWWSGGSSMVEPWGSRPENFNGIFCYKDGENVMGHFVEDCQQYGFSQDYIGISAEETGLRRYSPTKRVNLTNKKRGFQPKNNRI